MPSAGTTNPSPHAAARRATADNIQELRTKYTLLESLVQDLKEAYAANRQLRSKVVHLEAQLSTLGDTVQSLLEFKSQATRLLQVLVSNHGVDELKAQVLSLALQSNDPNTFLKSVVDGENPSDETDGNGGNTLLPLGNCLHKGVIAPVWAIKELKPELILYPHGLTRNDPGWPGEGVGDERRPFLWFDFTKPPDDPINVEGFKEYCKFVRNRGAEQVPAATDIIAKATNATIQEQCQMKYKYEAEKYKQYLKERSQGDVPPQTINLKRAGILKLKARAQKLSKMVIPYSTMELQTFLTPGAQSDDESEYKILQDGTERKTGQYITHGWSFMSKQERLKKALAGETLEELGLALQDELEGGLDPPQGKLENPREENEEDESEDNLYK
ncbi:hypothetical protein RHS01_11179 [Rhizoctonia solani]|uniref:Uncharacterized protein n=1 Tax=Rhizoctonia solani TaxID=456999 RepID=A0A8H7I234_9AGAM|nr:hypothetical protein RHS01_11179 [Rhizoctonia solani]